MSGEKIFGNIQPAKPQWIDTGTHIFEITRQKMGNTASDLAIVMQTWRRTGIALTQLSTLMEQQNTAKQMAVAVSLSPQAPD